MFKNFFESEYIKFEGFLTFLFFEIVAISLLCRKRKFTSASILSTKKGDTKIFLIFSKIDLFLILQITNFPGNCEH